MVLQASSTEGMLYNMKEIMFHTAFRDKSLLFTSLHLSGREKMFFK